jgi:DNA-binding NtrC family response regulator
VPLKRVAKEAICDMGRNVIRETPRVKQWNRCKTAQALKITYRALIDKIRDTQLISKRANLLSETPQSGVRTPQPSTE